MNSMLVTNARIITAKDVFTGTVEVVNGRIVNLESGLTALHSAHDWQGDYLIAGLVELHTDNLEKHLLPRPGVFWPAVSAFLAHDAQLAAAGITTVFDAICLGDIEPDSPRERLMHASVAALRSVRDSENIRCEHWLHLRCEVANPDVVAHYEQLADEPFVRLVSVMDHTPGQRQWVDLDKYRKYTQRMGVLSDAAYEDLVSYRSRMQRLHARKNRAAIVSHAKARGVTLASHDDTTLEHVAEAAAEQIGISEFPTTLDAARAAREHGMTTIMGAPNIVRRGSHSGNVAAVELARAGLLDGLSSDYVPASLLHGAFMLAHEAAYSLPNALATVSHNTARMAGFDDRGEIAIGMRADLVRVRLRDQEPTVVGTWRAGVKVA